MLQERSIRLMRRARRLLEREQETDSEGDRLDEYAVDPSLVMSDAGFAPDPWQADFLRSNDQFNLILCGRQIGKTLAVSILALFTALTRPGSTTVVIAQREFQATELLRKVVTHYHRIRSPIGVKREGATYLELANRARVFVLPAKESAVNGPTADLLIIDEAARIPDEVFHAASPQLSASKGRLVALSTAFAKSGWFYKQWTTGGDSFRRWSITAPNCPRHSPAFLEKERREMGDRWFAMAYLNQFGDDVAAVFSSEDIAAMRDENVKPLFPEMNTVAPLSVGMFDPSVKPLVMG